MNQILAESMHALSMSSLSLTLYGPQGSRIIVHNDILDESPLLRRLADASPEAFFGQDFMTDPKPIAEYLQHHQMGSIDGSTTETLAELHLAFGVARLFGLTQFMTELEQQLSTIFRDLNVPYGCFAIAEIAYGGNHTPAESYRNFFKEEAIVSFLEFSSEKWISFTGRTTLGISKELAGDIHTALRDATDKAVDDLNRLEDQQEYLQYTLIHKRAPPEGFALDSHAIYERNASVTEAEGREMINISGVVKSGIEILEKFKADLKEAKEKMDHTMQALQIPQYRKGD